MTTNTMGPLGQLPGMTYDPIRQRYFQTTKPSTLPEKVLIETGCSSNTLDQVKGGDEIMLDENGAGSSRRRRRVMRVRGNGQDRSNKYVDYQAGYL